MKHPLRLLAVLAAALLLPAWTCLAAAPATESFSRETPVVRAVQRAGPPTTHPDPVSRAALAAGVRGSAVHLQK